MYEKPTLQSELIKENTIILAWLRSALKQNQTQPVERTILKKKKIYTYKDAINKDKDRGSWTFDSDTFKEYGERGLNISAKHMDSLLELLIKHKIEMTLGIYPWPSQIYYDTVDSKHVLFWETWAKRNNVKFINHFEDFFLLKDKTGPKQLIEEYYIPGDVHFNEKGNILMKEYFLSQYPQ
mgnify:FL=1